MLIIKSFLLATYFLIQVAVLAAPIPLNAREISFNDSGLFSRSGKGNDGDKDTGAGKGTIFGTCTLGR